MIIRQRINISGEKKLRLLEKEKKKSESKKDNRREKKDFGKKEETDKLVVRTEFTTIPLELETVTGWGTRGL